LILYKNILRQRNEATKRVRQRQGRKSRKNKAETADNKKPAQGPVFHATT
jgi:hypothetical protein